MVVRFLAAVSLLLTVAVTPALWRARPLAYGASQAVSVVAAPAAPAGPDEPEYSCEEALAGADPVRALAAAFAMARGGRVGDLLRAAPAYPSRLLHEIAGRRLDGHLPLAAGVIARLGGSARSAALELARTGGDAEREVARLALRILDGEGTGGLAAWRPRVEY